MGKDLKGKDLGRGYSQRKDKRFEARAMINGTKICLYDMHLPTLKKRFDDVEENMDKSRWYLNKYKELKGSVIVSNTSTIQAKNNKIDVINIPLDYQ